MKSFQLEDGSVYSFCDNRYQEETVHALEQTANTIGQEVNRSFIPRTGPAVHSAGRSLVGHSGRQQQQQLFFLTFILRTLEAW